MLLSFGFLSAYPPTRCGPAIFTSSLANQLAAAGHRTGVVRVIDAPESYPAHDRLVPVVQHLVRDSRHGPALAAAALAGFDVAVIQHTFDTYDGAAVADITERLTVPVIVVAHSVHAAPTDHQRAVFQRLVTDAGAVVTMSETARRRLGSDYGIDPATVVVIPHGALPDATTNTEAARTPVPPTILSWGLLGPSRGIESMIDAMALLRHLQPEPRYLVVGPTHPRVFARYGEAYRHGLMARTIDRDVARLVAFRSSYLDAVELSRVVAQADVVALPYESRDLANSAVLSEAVTAGRPVVATAFPYAVELLAGGAGIVVPHDDAHALARAVLRVLTEPDLAATMSRHAIRTAPVAQWRAVAREYRILADTLVSRGLPAAV